MPPALRCVLTLLAVGVALVACTSPGPGRAAGIERQSEAQWQEIIDNVPALQDADTMRRVAAVAARVLLAAEETPADWQVVVFDAPDTVNAFALPSRRIGVFSGLLSQTRSDDQLAAVIGHEIAHVRLRHAEARLNRNLAPGILIGVARLPGAVTGVGALETAGDLAGSAVAVGTILPFSRQEELDADRDGLLYLFRAGYDPSAAAAFWRGMGGGGTSRKPPEVLSTHPSDARRIAALEKAARDLSEAGSDPS